METEGDIKSAGVLKLVDKPDLGSGAVRRMGSIPFARTQKKLSYIAGLFSSAQVPNVRSKGIEDSRFALLDHFNMGYLNEIGPRIFLKTIERIKKVRTFAIVT